MKKHLTLAVFLVIGSLAACGGKSKPAPVEPAPVNTAEAPAPAETGAAPAAPTDADIDAAADATVAMLVSMAQVFTDAGEDCDKLGTDLDAWATTNTATIQETAQKAQSLPEDKFGEAMRTRMENAPDMMAPIMNLSQKCAENAKFQAAMQKLETIGG